MIKLIETYENHKSLEIIFFDDSYNMVKIFECNHDLWVELILSFKKNERTENGERMERAKIVVYIFIKYYLIKANWHNHSETNGNWELKWLESIENPWKQFESI